MSFFVFQNISGTYEIFVIRNVWEIEKSAFAKLFRHYLKQVR